ncbi:MAG: hypothetical protein V9G04_17865 [Nocardioides sp.]|jgi:hypothetical protein
MRRVWDLAVEVVRLEVALYACLWRWITRRPDVPAGARPIPYAQLSAPMVWLFVFGSGIEVIVIEVILRSLDQAWADAIRLPVLILGIWGVIWMIGLAAAYRTRPHLLTSEALYARSFALTDVAVPLSAIKKVSAVEQEVEGIRFVHKIEDRLVLAVSSRTNLRVELREHLTLPLRRPSRLWNLWDDERKVTVDSLAIWVDEPREVAALLTGVTTR